MMVVGVFVGVSPGAGVFVAVGMGVLVAVATGVSVGGTPVLVGVGDGGSVGVSVISTGPSWAETTPAELQPGRAIITKSNAIVAKTIKYCDEFCFITELLLEIDRRLDDKLCTR
jgi:hypothetical protein